ncbi:MAG: hypothetical protein J3R72DRAFT_481112 [Linnemannia gamsii]|nr:MAG: hypothetical protein J3R72DRAFT_481112 [Linnemannia gamsii]
MSTVGGSCSLSPAITPDVKAARIKPKNDDILSKQTKTENNNNMDRLLRRLLSLLLTPGQDRSCSCHKSASSCLNCWKLHLLFGAATCAVLKEDHVDVADVLKNSASGPELPIYESTSEVQYWQQYSRQKCVPCCRPHEMITKINDDSMLAPALCLLVKVMNGKVQSQRMALRPLFLLLLVKVSQFVQLMSFLSTVNACAIDLDALGHSSLAAEYTNW